MRSLLLFLATAATAASSSAGGGRPFLVGDAYKLAEDGGRETACQLYAMDISVDPPSVTTLMTLDSKEFGFACTNTRTNQMYILMGGSDSASWPKYFVTLDLLSKTTTYSPYFNLPGAVVAWACDSVWNGIVMMIILDKPAYDNEYLETQIVFYDPITALITTFMRIPHPYFGDQNKQSYNSESHTWTLRVDIMWAYGGDFVVFDLAKNNQSVYHFKPTDVNYDFLWIAQPDVNVLSGLNITIGCPPQSAVTWPHSLRCAQVMNLAEFRLDTTTLTPIGRPYTLNTSSVFGMSAQLSPDKTEYYVIGLDDQDRALYIRFRTNDGSMFVSSVYNVDGWLPGMNFAYVEL